mgnify:CR=1 FL=1|jgi:bifunctional DNA-binding transcriptional regulator/antitoxin component of YhaV-PrlF toxin-antitoxin module
MAYSSWRKQELKLKKSNTYTSKVLEICDNGDAIIELPPELCEELGWKEGDTLDISQEPNGQIVIKKIDNGH